MKKHSEFGKTVLLIGVMTAQLFGWEKQVELLSGVSISSLILNNPDSRSTTLTFLSPTTLGLSFLKNNLLFGFKYSF
jgi:hypothetical protein